MSVTVIRKSSTSSGAKIRGPTPARIAELRQQLADRMLYRFNDAAIDEAIRLGHRGVLVEAIHPPSKEVVLGPSGTPMLDAQGQPIKKFKYPSDMTHFSGWTPGCPEPNHYAGGTPLMALVQGFPDKETRLGDPKTLPDGLTALHVLNKMLLLRAKGKYDMAMATRTVWVGDLNRLDVYIVRDPVEWDEWQKTESLERQKAKAPEPEPKTITLTEYMASKGSKGSKTK